MNKYKICVYAISKNEEQFVNRWMDAVNEADIVVVTDTGSTDNTVELLRKRGAIVYSDTIDPWRFDTARNTALDHIPDDVDICVSNDLDEVFEPGWRKKLEEAWKSYHTRARYMFTWSYKDDGSPDKQFMMEKIHCRHGYRWVHPVHEVLEYTEEGNENFVWVDGMVLNHHPDETKPRSQYLPLLELSAQENPDDDRGMFWLGREYMYYGKFDKAINVLTKYLKMEKAVWDEERCAAMRFIARCYKFKGNILQSKIWMYRAIAECQHVREPYIDMARLAYDNMEWHLVYLMVTKALNITEKTGSYLTEISSWDSTLYDFGAICTYYLGLYELSYNYIKKAVKENPNDERLKGNMELIRQKQ